MKQSKRGAIPKLSKQRRSTQDSDPIVNLNFAKSRKSHSIDTASLVRDNARHSNRSAPPPLMAQYDDGILGAAPGTSVFHPQSELYIGVRTDPKAGDARLRSTDAKSLTHRNKDKRGQSNAGGRNEITRQNQNQGHRIQSNPVLNGEPNRRNRQNIIPNGNQRTERQAHAQQLKPLSINSKDGNHNQVNSIREGKNGQNGNENKARNRSNKDMTNVRKQTNPSVNQQKNTDRRGGRRGRPIHFKYLEDLLKLDEEDFVLTISTTMDGLNEFVDKIDLSDDGYVLLIQILKKIFDSRFPSSQQILVQIILKERFVKNLQKYLGSLPMHDGDQKRKNKFFWQNTNAFWTMLIEICRKTLEMLPNFALNILPKMVLALQVCIPSFELHQSQCVSDEIKAILGELDRALQAMKSRVEDETAGTVSGKYKKKFRFEGEEPPDDFRTISVYPEVSELSGGRNFVRPNIIDGPYKDVHHYLDVQFRLLREDFVNPLRCGVRSILSGEIKRFENVRVYKKVRFLHQETINEYHCIRLKFNFSQKKLNFSFENSKKFMFGTLLCFTCDNFATMKFARVIKRDTEDLKKGELIVGFDTPQPDLSFDHDYLMIECSIYFEPYFHVLTALKNINENEFPMKEYIVDVQPSDAFPNYLNLDTVYEIDGKGLYIEYLMYTSKNLYGFNDSQMTAFKAAITQEFAIIQGPPGTGKTFLGLKIAKTLLDNHAIWYKSTPMLVICFTNHALDQFLEGLLDTTKNIARVGGQSKNAKLEFLNLTMLRKKGSDQTYMRKNQVQNAIRELGSVTAAIKEIEQYDGIISFSTICDNVPGAESLFDAGDSGCFIKWLLEGSRDQCSRSNQYQQNVYIDRPKNRKGEQDDLENISVDDYLENIVIDDDDANADRTYQSFAEFLPTDMEFSAPTTAITLKNMETRMNALQCQLDTMEKQKKFETAKGFAWESHLSQIKNTKRDLIELEKQYIYFEKRLAEVRDAIQNQLIRTNINATNPALLSHDDRWALYTFWVNSVRQSLQRRAAILTDEFQGLYRQYEEVQNLEDTRLLRTKLVVGMTTTSAARLRTVIDGLCSPIVIFEEAAEVLEAHITTALQKHCQHLILIGDHKQLKPSSADYEITKDYNLGVSLFERMVNNGLKCHTLNIQHRMRPEFSRLICPIIYPDLRDHESVFDRPPIAGIDSCIRFITHTHPEHHCDDNPTKKNLHEVEFAVALARHLILNGYKPEQVTILAAYLGQMFEIIKERERYGSIIKNVRVAALDNYQGEESDIIILSLVRSNKEHKIGFLATENRICVALSRAKHGFYIFGNMGLLSSVSELWRKIQKVLESQNAIGPDLLLRCGIHTDIITRVTKGKDFEKLSEGGCDQICNAVLVCGHSCRSLCHIQDRDHKNYECLQRCNKNLCDQDENHICQKMCFEKCGPCIYKVARKLNCGHELSLNCHIDPDTYECPVLVLTKLPCDHIVDKPCHIDINTFVCPMPCENIVDPCGHTCTRKCHIRDDPDHIEYKCMKKCARPRVGCTMPTDDLKHSCNKLCCESCSPCDIQLKKKRTICSHVHQVDCNQDVDAIKCERPCTKLLSCQHKCKKKCNEPCEPSICLIKVDKVLKICGHRMVTPCREEPNRNRCDKKCPLKLPCGHPCTERCNQVCTPQCQVLIDCRVDADCGHVITKMACHDFNSDIAKTDRRLLKNCSIPCNVELKCGHKCSGTCGECSQGRFHKRCAEKCGVPLVCNHECEFPCREACRACNKPCTYRCVHSVCTKKCGEICIACKEPCPRKCEHQKCGKLCSSICEVPPCTEPCQKLLDCGHACIGFCGDPCPPKCLICDREELLEIFFGTEDENARFVFLLDCKHVVENEGIENWLAIEDSSSAIAVKVCPKCKAPIKTTTRYSDHIKRAFNDVNRVKIKAVGLHDENSKTRWNLLEKIKILRDQFKSSIWDSYLQKLSNRLEPVRNQTRQKIDKIQLTAMTSKLQVLEHLLQICKDPKELSFCPEYQNEIYDVLARDINYITSQEIGDVMSELQRLHRAIQYERIKLSPKFSSVAAIAKAKPLIENIEMALNRLGSYINDDRLKSWLNELNKIMGAQLALTEVERRQIVEALGMKAGHWFKCPNGHPYVITECGGAMVKSRCNECGAAIGGGNHTLLTSNSLAPEMDGASHPAWSNTANYMANFDFDQFN